MKKYLYGSAILVIVFMLFTKVNKNLQKDITSDIILTNIEALAASESGEQTMTCYAGVENEYGKPLETQTYCGDCKPIYCTHWYNELLCRR